MNLEQLMTAIRKAPADDRSLEGIAMWLYEDSPYTLRSVVEISADGRHLLVWRVRTPSANAYLLRDDERAACIALGVPYGKANKTETGLTLAA